MSEAENADPQWEQMKDRLDGLDPQETIELDMADFGAPRETWVPTVLGIPYIDTKRQWRDGCYHIHETRKGTYKFHRDEYDPKIAPVKHMVFDATRTLSVMAVGTTLALGLVGRMVRRRML